MAKRLNVLVFLLCLFLFVLPFSRLALGQDYVIVKLADQDLRIYAVALDGVSAHGVSNMEKAVDGVLHAARVNETSLFLRYEIEQVTFGGVSMHTNVTVIRDWDSYREIVETGSHVIIVNCHGETVPVPLGYGRGEWVDKIADAMAQRNVTWVHTTLYPFYYSYVQEGEEQTWGEDGFKRLMDHIGKGNITCQYVGSKSENDLVDECGTDIRGDWPALGECVKVQIGKPLYYQDIRNVLKIPIWGYSAEFMPGAVLSFKNDSQSSNFGFYVHIGTNQTYNCDAGGYLDPPTDSEFLRTYAGTAAAMFTNAWYFAARDAISDAEDAIAQAENEGRTKDLGTAKELLYKAVKAYPHYSIQFALEAKAIAQNAAKPVNPSLFDVYGWRITAVCVLGAIFTVVLLIKRKNDINELKNQ